MDISVSREVDKKDSEEKGCIESFNYGELNKEHEMRDTECNHIIYHPKQDTIGSDKHCINT